MFETFAHFFLKPLHFQILKLTNSQIDYYGRRKEHSAAKSNQY